MKKPDSKRNLKKWARQRAQRRKIGKIIARMTHLEATCLYFHVVYRMTPGRVGQFIAMSEADVKIALAAATRIYAPYFDKAKLAEFWAYGRGETEPAFAVSKDAVNPGHQRREEGKSAAEATATSMVPSSVSPTRQKAAPAVEGATDALS